MSTFPKILDSPDMVEVFTQIWNDDVMKVLNSSQKESINMMCQKTTEYLHKVYPVLFSDEFGWTQQTATACMRGVKSTIATDKDKFETRKKML